MTSIKTKKNPDPKKSISRWRFVTLRVVRIIGIVFADSIIAGEVRIPRSDRPKSFLIEDADDEGAPRYIFGGFVFPEKRVREKRFKSNNFLNTSLHPVRQHTQDPSRWGGLGAY